MQNSLNLKEAERKAFRVTFQDGLWDMFIGLMLLQFAIAPLLTDLGWGDFWSSFALLPVYLLALLGLRFVKNTVTLPRAGLVKYHEQRVKKVSKLTTVMTIILFLGLIFGLIFFVADNINDWFFPIAFSAIALICFSTAAYYLDFPRLYAYGMLTALSPLAGQILYETWGASHHGFPITFGISSAVMIAIGICLFIRFLLAYPLNDMQA
jgi:hypothetical protein